MTRRNRKGRFAKQRTASRWEQIVCLSILGGIFLGVAIDAMFVRETNYVYAKEEEVVVVQPQEVQIRVVVDWTTDRIETQLRTAAEKYGVSYEKLHKTIECESGFNIDIQSGHYLSYGREESWGLAQFHLPSKNKTADGVVITKEMALDPIIALDSMAYHFSIGNAKLWTCYRKLYM